MKIAIVGSRDYPDLLAVRNYVVRLPKGTTVISGGARGVDTIAIDTALNCQWLYTVVYHADWKAYGKSAGYIRNREIVAACDEVVAFWDEKSSGTRHTIRLAEQAGKPVTVVTTPHA